jgi:glutamate racemase
MISEMSPKSFFRFPSLRLFGGLMLFLWLISASPAAPASPGGKGTASGKEALASLFQKTSLKVAVTDSGLGGLSVAAEAVRKIKDARIFGRCDFVFFNALFSNEGGYNSLKTREEKILVFDSALESLERKFQPDIILIGCNTLSVLVADTPFSKRAKIPVVGIVDSGVEIIAGAMREHPEASVVIFGTPTTISEGTYQERLMKQGFPAGRILAQSCPELESYIENDPQSDETGMLISGCVSEARPRLSSPPPPLLVSLNCTHYGYSLPLWERAFEEAGIKPLALLNPNSRMTEILVNREYTGRFKKTEVTVKVVSMVDINRQKIDSLAPWLERISPETAEALRRADHQPSLFEWKRYVKR